MARLPRGRSPPEFARPAARPRRDAAQPLANSVFFAIKGAILPLYRQQGYEGWVVMEPRATVQRIQSACRVAIDELRICLRQTLFVGGIRPRGPSQETGGPRARKESAEMHQPECGGDGTRPGPPEEPRAATLESDPLLRARELAAERMGEAGALPQIPRREVFAQYRRSLQARAEPGLRWRELGPRPLLQDIGPWRVEVSGRVTGLAVAPGGRVVFAAGGNGGVWKSEDAGVHWTFTMEGFDEDPTHLSSDTLACGAIALDPENWQRVYVGTGEPRTGTYLGIGPLLSLDGGRSWAVEGVEGASPPLAGRGFFGLAVHRENPDAVFGATTGGLYLRRLASRKGRWRQVWQQETTSVVTGVAGGRAVVYAARRGGPILAADAGAAGDIAAWRVLGEGNLWENAGRISLAIAGADAAVVFALVADVDGFLHGLYRLETEVGTWQPVAGVPPALFGTRAERERGYGDWCQAIAVDPAQPSRVFLGGGALLIDGKWAGALFRCHLTSSGKACTHAFIGLGVHADVQALALSPDRQGELWAATDGGVFTTTHAAEEGVVLESRNQNLGTVTLNHLGQHPHEEAFYCGSQDNGCIRYQGGGNREWNTAVPGDCGFVVINWADPKKVLAALSGTDLALLERGADGEHRRLDLAPFRLAEGEEALFTPPLAGTPPTEQIDPANAHQAERVAFGSERPWISDDFGHTWDSIPFGNLEQDRVGRGEGQAIRSLLFASYGRLYAGTEAGAVYRYDFDSGEGVWRRVRLAVSPDLPADWTTAQAFTAPVTAIALDPSDGSGRSIYVTLGGTLESAGELAYQRLWHFDGTVWVARSGPQDDDTRQLLPVQHNAVAVDPRNPDRIWVGADIGVWYSPDRGSTWQPFQTGLPDAAVIDLQLHPTLRLLRAATHGRGAFEIPVDGNWSQPTPEHSSRG